MTTYPTLDPTGRRTVIRRTVIHHTTRRPRHRVSTRPSVFLTCSTLGAGWYPLDLVHPILGALYAGVALVSAVLVALHATRTARAHRRPKGEAR